MAFTPDSLHVASTNEVILPVTGNPKPMGNRNGYRYRYSISGSGGKDGDTIDDISRESGMVIDKA
jgi:hypothetical protein